MRIRGVYSIRKASEIQPFLSASCYRLTDVRDSARLRKCFQPRPLSPRRLHVHDLSLSRFRTPPCSCSPRRLSDCRSSSHECPVTHLLPCRHMYRVCAVSSVQFAIQHLFISYILALLGEIEFTRPWT